MRKKEKKRIIHLYEWNKSSLNCVKLLNLSYLLCCAFETVVNRFLLSGQHLQPELLIVLRFHN